MTARLSVSARIAEAVRLPASPLRQAEPCAVVIFGAGGDLTRRKLLPALFHLKLDGLLPDAFAVVGVAREPLDDRGFRAGMRRALDEFGPPQVDQETWRRFEPQLHYVSGDLADPASYERLRRTLAAVDATLPAASGHLFYLAVPPSVYTTVIERLSQAGLAARVHAGTQRPWRRVIIEKPFGHSLERDRALNAVVRQALAEHQVYRIDHYLGKETVQNLLVLRFANSIFEPVWNRQHVHHVQITTAESVGVGHRARYYEEAGVVRDMFQNHLLQLLTLTAMEPPVRFNADAVRDEKVKVLRAIRAVSPAEIDDYAVRGQYGPGTMDGEPVPGYRAEPGVAPESATPTYAAVRFMLDTWRWQGVPFYLRSGKRLPRRVTEIAIQFRQPPHLMFPLEAGQTIDANVLALRIQPKEGMALCFQVKVPGAELRMLPVDMNFDYCEAFGEAGHEAYETLLLDCMLGDATLFARSDEVEAAWSVVDPITAHWEQQRPAAFPNYAAGTWGPAAADDLIAPMGCRWREP